MVFRLGHVLMLGGLAQLSEANDYRTQVQVGQALKASGKKRSDVFVTTKCPGAIGFNATLQCGWDGY